MQPSLSADLLINRLFSVFEVSIIEKETEEMVNYVGFVKRNFLFLCVWKLVAKM